MRYLILLFLLLLPMPAYGVDAILSWTDNSGNETGFKIERNLNGGAFTALATVNSNVVTVTDTTPVQSQTVDNVYCYRLYAYNTAGNSAFTAPACKTILKPPPVVTIPAAPSNLTIQ